MENNILIDWLRDNIPEWLNNRLGEKGREGIFGWEHLENWVQIELWCKLKNALPEGYRILNMEPPKIITGKPAKEKWPDMLVFSPSQRHFLWWEIKYIRAKKTATRGITSFTNDLCSLLTMSVEKTCDDYCQKRRKNDKRDELIKKFNSNIEEFCNVFLKGEHHAIGLAIINCEAAELENFKQRLKKECELEDSNLTESKCTKFVVVLAAKKIHPK